MEPWESEGFGTDRAVVEAARPGHWPSVVWEYHVLKLARELSRRDGFVEALFRVAEALKERGVLEADEIALLVRGEEASPSLPSPRSFPAPRHQ